MILHARIGWYDHVITVLHRCTRLLIRQVTTDPQCARQARSDGWPASEGRLQEWHRALNWGRLLHLSQQDRLGRLSRLERAELRDLRYRQRVANRSPLITWLLHDNWL